MNCGNTKPYRPHRVEEEREPTWITYFDCDGVKIENNQFIADRPCPTKTPEEHLLGEFPMTCYSCHVYADS